MSLVDLLQKNDRIRLQYSRCNTVSSPFSPKNSYCWSCAESTFLLLRRIAETILYNVNVIRENNVEELSELTNTVNGCIATKENRILNSASMFCWVKCSCNKFPYSADIAGVGAAIPSWIEPIMIDDKGQSLEKRPCFKRKRKLKEKIFHIYIYRICTDRYIDCV